MVRAGLTEELMLCWVSETQSRVLMFYLPPHHPPRENCCRLQHSTHACWGNCLLTSSETMEWDERGSGGSQECLSFGEGLLWSWPLARHKSSLYQGLRILVRALSCITMKPLLPETLAWGLWASICHTERNRRLGRGESQMLKQSQTPS